MSPQIYILHFWPFLGFLSISSYGHQSAIHIIPTYKSHSYPPPTPRESLKSHVIYHPDPQGILFSLVLSLFLHFFLKPTPVPDVLYNFWTYHRTLHFYHLPANLLMKHPPASNIIINHFAESYPIHHASVGNSNPTSRTPGYLRNRRIFNHISYRKSPRKCHPALC
jgi:hypothetical protein